MSYRRSAALLALAAALAAQPALAQTATPPAATATSALIPTESYTLPNGLRVVMNVDKSDPVVAVALVAHVGSGREVPGRTGFAHLFEHLFFLNSENLGPGGLDKLSARVGGEGANGYTNLDQTVYLQTVPSDALEKMLWAEADKLGFFINTVTPAVVAKEIEVVKNEKRQRNDNVPYGQVLPIAQAALFPPDHPYSWTTIGSLADLSAATIDDVRAFYRRWYVPNNVSLVISGDFDPAQVRVWVDRYFGEIARGQATDIPQPRLAMLPATKRLTHVDNFAPLPQLSVFWPTSAEGTPDTATSELMFAALTEAPDGPIYRAIVEEQKLSESIDGFVFDNQMAGMAIIIARGFDGVPLDKLSAAIDAGIARFKREGISAERLERIKATREAGLYQQIGSVSGKVQMIAESETLSRRPDMVDGYLARLKATTPADIMAALDRYIAGRPRLEIGSVPKGQEKLALTGASTAVVEAEEAIVQGAEAAVDQTADRAEVPRTPSRIDRSVEPPFGSPPVVTTPAIWSGTLANGMGVSGIEDRELPVVAFQIAIDGGQLRDDPAKPGAASLVADMLMRGTQNRTREEFLNALKALGASLSVDVDQERTVITGTTLARNFDATAALVREMLTRPRWDAAELELARAAATAGIQASRAEPEELAELVARQVIYGRGALANDVRGTPASVAALTMDDLKRFMADTYSPRASRIRVTGAVTQGQVTAAFAPLAAAWTATAAPKPLGSISFAAPARTQVYFYDVPGAKQSAILFARPGVARSAPDFFPGYASNFILGGGGFASRLTQELREGKGYTYSAGSRFDGDSTGGRVQLSAPVRANVTLESATLMRDLMRDYGATYTDADLALTRESLAKARARSFETPAAKLGLLARIGDDGLPADYIARENAALAALDKPTVQRIARTYLDTDKMIVVVVGDAATQAGRLEALGYGKPVMVPPLK
ncbi:M16 family metallopeptidase [Sphingomonas sp. FW199]|uniref:M16 family metallopeptidase n=1 Tax=Sphingomonas sp. FW199 TaxID=3400217 RepID=UPI003CF47AA1